MHIIRQHQTCYCGSKSKVQFNLKQTSRGLLLLYNEQTFNRDIYIYIYVDYICWQLLKYFVRDIFGVIFTFNFFFKYTIQQWVLGVSCVTYQITAEVNQCLDKYLIWLYMYSPFRSVFAITNNARGDDSAGVFIDIYGQVILWIAVDRLWTSYL